MSIKLQTDFASRSGPHISEMVDSRSSVSIKNQVTIKYWAIILIHRWHLTFDLYLLSSRSITSCRRVPLDILHHIRHAPPHGCGRVVQLPNSNYAVREIEKNECLTSELEILSFQFLWFQSRPREGLERIIHQQMPKPVVAIQNVQESNGWLRTHVCFCSPRTQRMWIHLWRT